MTQPSPVVALLMVGGAGKSLWPISNEARPKQFLKLFADRSLFQSTLARVAGVGADEILVITGQAHAGQVKDQISELGNLPSYLLLEPGRRDSAAAIAAGVAWVKQNVKEDAIIAALPSDHFHSRYRGLSSRTCTGSCDCPRGVARNVRNQANRCNDRIWLYPAGRPPRGRFAPFGH